MMTLISPKEATMIQACRIEAVAELVCNQLIANGKPISGVFNQIKRHILKGSKSQVEVPPMIQWREMMRKEEGDEAADSWYESLNS